MEELPNGWTWEAARDRAMALLGEGVSPGVVEAKVPWGCLRSVALYIAQHEKPPVDPDLMLAREIAALVARGVGQINYADSYREGKFDNQPEMIAALKLFKERK